VKLDEEQRGPEVIVPTLRDQPTPDQSRRTLLLGLQDIQGYDDSHLAHYDAYLAALTGATQDYYDASIFSTGLGSPLLDLLNARYVIVPLNGDTRRFFNDGLCGRPGQNPRKRGGLSTGVDRAHCARSCPRRRCRPPTHCLRFGGCQAYRPTGGASTLVEVPADSSPDQAVVLENEANRLEVRTSTSAAGLLVLSEIYYLAWKAYVDGQPVHPYVADGALRDVAVPVGEHTVELRFESDTLRIGMLLSGAATVLLAVLAWRGVAEHD
jgi:hypothetical protein